MSGSGFRGRGFGPRGAHNNGPNGAFGGPRYPHQNFHPRHPTPYYNKQRGSNQQHNPSKFNSPRFNRPPCAESWMDHPPFPPWHGNASGQFPAFPQRPPPPPPRFPCDMNFRPGRGRGSNLRGNIKFPGRPPGHLSAPPRYNSNGTPGRGGLNSTPSETKTSQKPQTPLLGSEEERQKKITETANKLKEKLSSKSMEEDINLWQDDIPLAASLDDVEVSAISNKGIPELKHEPPELNLTFNDLKDIGRVDLDKCDSIQNGTEDNNEILVQDAFLNETNEEVLHFDSDNQYVSPFADSLENITPGKSCEVEDIEGAIFEKELEEHFQTELEQNIDNCLFQENINPEVIQDENVQEQISQVEKIQLGKKLEHHRFSQEIESDLLPLREQEISTDCQHELATSNNINTQTDSLFPPKERSNNKSKVLKDEKDSTNIGTNVSLDSSKATSSSSCAAPGQEHSVQQKSDVVTENTVLGRNEKSSDKTYNSKSEIQRNSRMDQTQRPSRDPKKQNQFQTPEDDFSRKQARPRDKRNRSLQYGSSMKGKPNFNMSWQGYNNQVPPFSAENFPPYLPNGPHLMTISDPLQNREPFNSMEPSPSFNPAEVPLNLNHCTPQSETFQHPPPYFQAPPPVVNNTPSCTYTPQQHSAADENIRLPPVFDPRLSSRERSNLITCNTLNTSLNSNLIEGQLITDFSIAPNFSSMPSLTITQPAPFIPPLNYSMMPSSTTVPIAMVPPTICTTANDIPLPRSEELPHKETGPINMEDELGDMKEALAFAEQLVNMTTDSETTCTTSKLPKDVSSKVNEAPSPDLTLIEIPKDVQQKDHSKKKTNKHSTSAEKSQNVPRPVHREEKNLQTNYQEDEPRLIDERPKVVFNLNSKKKITVKDEWQQHDAKSKQRPKLSKASSNEEGQHLVTSSPDYAGFDVNGYSEQKQKCKESNHNKEAPKHLQFSITSDTLEVHSSEKNETSSKEKNYKTQGISIAEESTRKSRKSTDPTLESSWKNRVINRFLKMSKNDICNMVNNSSLRKFDIAMKRLVKEKRSSLSMEMRNTEDEKIKSYDREEFMNQLTAMLDPGAVVDITNLPTDFIHHLSEVLQLDPMPAGAEGNLNEEPCIEIVDHKSRKSDTPEPEVENPRISRSHETAVPQKPKEKTSSQNSSRDKKSKIEATSSNSEIEGSSRNAKQSKVKAIESFQLEKPKGNHSESSSRFSRHSKSESVEYFPLEKTVVSHGELCSRSSRYSKPDLSNPNESTSRTSIIPTMEHSPFDRPSRDHEEVVSRSRRGNSVESMAHYKSFHEIEVLPSKATKHGQEMMAKIKPDLMAFFNAVMQKAESAVSKPVTYSFSQKPSFFDDFQVSKRWSRKERENVDTFRNLTKEEWEAKHGRSISLRDFRDRRTGSDTRDGFIRHTCHRKRTLSSDSPRRPTSLSPLPQNMCNEERYREQEIIKQLGKSANEHNIISSTDSESTPDVTKLLKVIKENEKLGKSKTLSETIRDEVTAEIERKRRDKDKLRIRKSRKKSRRSRKDKKEKRRKGHKKHKRRSRYSESSSEEDSDSEEQEEQQQQQQQQQLLTENDIKKEFPVKSESEINEFNASSPPNNRNQAIVETSSNLPVEKPSCPTTLSQTSEKGCFMHPKTKAQLKQMPESAESFPAISQSVVEDKNTVEDIPRIEKSNVPEVTKECFAKSVGKDAVDFNGSGSVVPDTPLEISNNSDLSVVSNNSGSKRLDIQTYKVRVQQRKALELEKQKSENCVSSEKVSNEGARGKDPIGTNKQTYGENKLSCPSKVSDDLEQEDVDSKTDDSNVLNPVQSVKEMPRLRSQPQSSTPAGTNLKVAKSTGLTSNPVADNVAMPVTRQRNKNNDTQKVSETTSNKSARKIARKVPAVKLNRCSIEKKSEVVPNPVQNADEVPMEENKFRNIKSEGKKELKLCEKKLEKQSQLESPQVKLIKLKNVNSKQNPATALHVVEGAPLKEKKEDPLLQNLETIAADRVSKHRGSTEKSSIQAENASLEKITDHENPEASSTPKCDSLKTQEKAKKGSDKNEVEIKVSKSLDLAVLHPTVAKDCLEKNSPTREIENSLKGNDSKSNSPKMEETQKCTAVTHKMKNEKDSTFKANEAEENPNLADTNKEDSSVKNTLKDISNKTSKAKRVKSSVSKCEKSEIIPMEIKNSASEIRQILKKDVSATNRNNNDINLSIAEEKSITSRNKRPKDSILNSDGHLKSKRSKGIVRKIKESPPETDRSKEIKKNDDSTSQSCHPSKPSDEDIEEGEIRDEEDSMQEKNTQQLRAENYKLNITVEETPETENNNQPLKNADFTQEETQKKSGQIKDVTDEVQEGKNISIAAATPVNNLQAVKMKLDPSSDKQEKNVGSDVLSRKTPPAFNVEPAIDEDKTENVSSIVLNSKDEVDASRMNDKVAIENQILFEDLSQNPTDSKTQTSLKDNKNVTQKKNLENVEAEHHDSNSEEAKIKMDTIGVTSSSNQSLGHAKFPFEENAQGFKNLTPSPSQQFSSERSSPEEANCSVKEFTEISFKGFSKDQQSDTLKNTNLFNTIKCRQFLQSNQDKEFLDDLTDDFGDKLESITCNVIDKPQNLEILTEDNVKNSFSVQRKGISNQEKEDECNLVLVDKEIEDNSELVHEVNPNAISSDLENHTAEPREESGQSKENDEEGGLNSETTEAFLPENFIVLDEYVHIDSPAHTEDTHISTCKKESSHEENSSNQQISVTSNLHLHSYTSSLPLERPIDFDNNFSERENEQNTKTAHVEEAVAKIRKENENDVDKETDGHPSKRTESPKVHAISEETSNFDFGKGISNCCISKEFLDKEVIRTGTVTENEITHLDDEEEVSNSTIALVVCPEEEKVAEISTHSRMEMQESLSQQDAMKDILKELDKSDMDTDLNIDSDHREDHPREEDSENVDTHQHSVVKVAKEKEESDDLVKDITKVAKKSEPTPSSMKKGDNDDLHRIKKKPKMKHKAEKKQSLSEKAVKEVIAEEIVTVVPKTKTKESVLGRMIEIDEEIHKLVNEKMTLYKMLQTLPSEVELIAEIITDPKAKEEVIRPRTPSVLMSQIIQNLETTPSASQPKKDHHPRERSKTPERKVEHDKRKSKHELLPKQKKGTNSSDDEEIIQYTSGPKTPIPKKKKRPKEERGIRWEDNVETDSTDNSSKKKQEVKSILKKPYAEEESKTEEEKKDSAKHAKKNVEIDESKEKVERPRSRAGKSDWKERSNNRAGGKLKLDVSVLTSHEKFKSKKNNEIKVPTKPEKKVNEEFPKPRKHDADMKHKKEGKEKKAEATSTEKVDEKKIKSHPKSKIVSEMKAQERMSIYSDESISEPFDQEKNELKKSNKGLALFEKTMNKELADSRKLKAKARKKKQVMLKNRSKTTKKVNSDGEEEQEDLSFRSNSKKSSVSMDHVNEVIDAVVAANLSVTPPDSVKSNVEEENSHLETSKEEIGPENAKKTDQSEQINSSESVMNKFDAEGGYHSDSMDQEEYELDQEDGIDFTEHETTANNATDVEAAIENLSSDDEFIDQEGLLEDVDGDSMETILERRKQKLLELGIDKNEEEEMGKSKVLEAADVTKHSDESEPVSSKLFVEVSDSETAVQAKAIDERKKDSRKRSHDSENLLEDDLPVQPENHHSELGVLKKRRKKSSKTTPVRRSSRYSDDNVKRSRKEENNHWKKANPKSRSPALLGEDEETDASSSMKKESKSQFKKRSRIVIDSDSDSDSPICELEAEILKLKPRHRRNIKKRKFSQAMMASCRVNLVDLKFTYLKENLDPMFLRKLGIRRINAYAKPSNPIAQETVSDERKKQVDDSEIVCIVTGKQRDPVLEIVELEAKSPDTVDLVEKSSMRSDEEEHVSDDNDDTNPVKGDKGKEVDKLSATSADKEIIEEYIESTEDPPRTQYTVHKGPILDIKVYGDSFLAASEDGMIYRYSQTSNGILNIYKGHREPVTCLYVLPMGTVDGAKEQIYSGSLDGTLRCYNIMTGVQIRDAADIGSPIQCMDQAWGMIYIGTKSGHVSRFSIKSGTVKGERIQFSDMSVLALKATNEGPRRVLIVASRSQPITIRDAQTGLFLRTISGQQSHTVYSLLRDHNLIYCGTSSTSIPVFDFTNGGQVVEYNAGVGIVCMRLYKQFLFAGCYDGNIYIFDTKEKKLICSVPGPGNMLLSIEVVKTKIIAGSKDKRLHAWQMPPQVLTLLNERTLQ